MRNYAVISRNLYKTKVFQITFPPILSYFPPLLIFFTFSGFMNSLIIENSKIFCKQTGFPIVFTLVQLTLPFRLQSLQDINMKHSNCVMYKNPLPFSVGSNLPCCRQSFCLGKYQVEVVGFQRHVHTSKYFRDMYILLNISETCKYF